MHTAALEPWDAAGILRRLDRLALCSEKPGEITRLFLTPQHRQAVNLVTEWMQQAGLATWLDASGTLVGHLAAATPQAPTLLMASHIDTVRNAGRYDGCLGVALAIAAAAQIGPGILPFYLEIRAFGDEEGVRFPITLTTAHAAAGSFNPGWLTVQDTSGQTLRQALQDFGVSPGDLLSGSCTSTAFAYLEAHIEQGPVLDVQGAPLGIVTAINGAERHEFTVTGRAGHAGTVPMQGRQDALVAAAHMVLAINEIAKTYADLVATVGRLSVRPDATNVIPGTCIFTMDLRAPDDAQRARAAAQILATLNQIAATQSATLSHRQTHAARAAACDPRLQAALAEAVTSLGLPAPCLPSGAGHDAMALAQRMPIGMLFLRCRGGISHHPDEHVAEDDVALALQALIGTLTRLSPAAFGV